MIDPTRITGDSASTTYGHTRVVTLKNHRKTVRHLDSHHCSSSFCHTSAQSHEYICDTNLLLSSCPLSLCERSSLPLEVLYLWSSENPKEMKFSTVPVRFSITASVVAAPIITASITIGLLLLKKTKMRGKLGQTLQRTERSSWVRGGERDRPLSCW